MGVGNCANSLVQGRYHHKNASATDFLPGPMRIDLGGRHTRDIELAAAFDIEPTAPLCGGAPLIGVR